MGVVVDEVDAFEQAASAAFAPMRVRPLTDEPFVASFEEAVAGPVRVTRIAGPPSVVAREAMLIGSSDPDLVKVALHVRGRAGVEQDGRQSILRPGDLVNYVTVRPYELHFWEPFETIVLGVPRGLLGAHADNLSGRTAIAVPTDRGPRQVVGALFTTLADQIEVCTLGESSRGKEYLADALVSMVIAELVETAPARAGDDLADRVLAHCLAHLSDPGLSVESIAQSHHVSVRYLHKVFEPMGLTLSAWIRSQRLARIRRELSDPTLADRTVAAIAARWGVYNAAHLSRALKAEFGMTAAEIRATAAYDRNVS